MGSISCVTSCLHDSLLLLKGKGALLDLTGDENRLLNFTVSGLLLFSGIRQHGLELRHDFQFAILGIFNDV